MAGKKIVITVPRGTHYSRSRSELKMLYGGKTKCAKWRTIRKYHKKKKAFHGVTPVRRRTRRRRMRA